MINEALCFGLVLMLVLKLKLARIAGNGSVDNCGLLSLNLKLGFRVRVRYVLYEMFTKWTSVSVRCVFYNADQSI